MFTIRVLMLLSVTANILFSIRACTVVNDLKNTIIYDLDQARYEYVSDILYYYQKGCLDGTEYPPEWANQSVGGWDARSPVTYCNNEREHLREHAWEKAAELGKRDPICK